MARIRRFKVARIRRFEAFMLFLSLWSLGPPRLCKFFPFFFRDRRGYSGPHTKPRAGTSNMKR